MTQNDDEGGGAYFGSQYATEAEAMKAGMHVRSVNRHRDALFSLVSFQMLGESSLSSIFLE